MKICVSSYSFHRYIKEGKLDFVSFLDKAKELGFEGVEYSSNKAEIGPMVPAIVAHAKEIGMPIATYLTSADFVNRDFDAEVARLKEEVDIAAALGVEKMRHDTVWGLPAGKTFEDILPRIALGVRLVSQYAKTKGIGTMVENHGQLVQDSARVVALYRAVNYDNFSLLADMGNFLCADEAPEKAYGNVLPYIGHVHAKDFFFRSGNEDDPGFGWFGTRAGNYLRGTIVGQGVVPVKQCIRLLKRQGYDGWVSLEFEGMEDNEIACKAGLENLRRIFGGVGV